MMPAGTAETHARVVALAWCAFQPRRAPPSAALGGMARFVHSRGMRARWTLPLRYVSHAIATWRVLGRDRPGVVIAITPPVFAPLVAFLWCKVNGAKLVMDCHTTAFHSRKWGWALPLHRWLARSSAVVTVHTERARDEVSEWTAATLLLPDDVPDAAIAEPQPRATRDRIVVAGSLDEQEPVAATIEAARLLPNVEVVFTGDVARLPPKLRRSAPANAVFTGWIAYPKFMGTLQSADVVAVFSLDPEIMNRAAFEAVGLGKPLVLSDLALLRARFADAAAFCSNESAEMAKALRQALRDRKILAARSVAARDRLIAERETALRGLVAAISDRHA